MELADLGIDQGELSAVVNAALKRVASPSAGARMGSCGVGTLETPRGERHPVVYLHVRSRFLREARGQYQPLDGSCDRGFIDEYVYGAIHAHWLALHGRDLFNEVRLVVDVDAEASEAPLYQYVSVEAACRAGEIPAGSPLARAIDQYSLQWVLQVGGWLSGPSPGMIEVVAEEIEGCDDLPFLDAYCGSCSLSRVALQHGAPSAVCLDKHIDSEAAGANLAQYAPMAAMRQGDLRGMIQPGERFSVAALDPFYDQTLGALEDALPLLSGRYQCAVLNLGLALETNWQRRVLDTVEKLAGPPRVFERYGERIAVCQGSPAC